MPVNVGTAEGYLKLNTSGFSDGMNNAEKSMDKFKGSTSDLKQKLATASTGMGNSFKAIGSAGAAAAKAVESAISLTVKIMAGVTAGLGALLLAGVNYNSSMEQYSAALTTLTGSADKAASILETLKKMGASTPFETKDLIDSTKVMMSFGISAEDAIIDVGMLGDVSMGNAEKLGSLTLAFSQVQSQGKLMGQDLLQFINAGFNPLKEISDKTGISMSELKDKMSDGAISAQMVSDAFKSATEQGGLFYGAMDKQSKTFAGQLSTLKDNAGQLLGTLTTGIQSALSETFLPAINEAIGAIAKAAESGGLKSAIAELGNQFGNILPMITSYIPAIVESVVGLITGFVQAIADNSELITTSAIDIVTTLIAGIATMYVAIATTAADIVIKLCAGIDEQSVIKTLESGASFVGDFASAISKAIPVLLETAKKIILGIVQYILDNKEKIFAGAETIVNSLANGIIDLLDTFNQPALDLLMAIVQFISENIVNLAAAAAKIVDYIATEILTPENLTVLFNGVMLFLGAIGTAISDNIGLLMESATTILKNVLKAMTDDTGAEDRKIAVVTFFQNVAKAITDNIGELASAGLAILNKLLDNMSGTAQEDAYNFTTAAFDFINKVVNEITAALSDSGVISKLATVGWEIAKGIVKGIMKEIADFVASGAIWGALGNSEDFKGWEPADIAPKSGESWDEFSSRSSGSSTPAKSKPIEKKTVYGYDKKLAPTTTINNTFNVNGTNKSVTEMANEMTKIHQAAAVGFR